MSGGCFDHPPRAPEGSHCRRRSLEHTLTAEEQPKDLQWDLLKAVTLVSTLWTACFG